MRPITGNGIRNGGAERELALALDRHVADALPVLLGVLAAIHALLVPLHLTVLSYEQAGRLAATSGLWAAGLAAAGLLFARRPVAAGRGHVAGAGIAVLVLANALLHLHWTDEPRQTVFVALIVLAAGLFLLDLGWLAVVAGAALAGWTAVAAGSLGEPEWIHYGFILVAATLLGAAVPVVRRRSIDRLERLRFEERVRQIELEIALEQTEGARKEGEEARAAMETAMVQVRESERRFRRLAEASFEGVLFFRDGRILDANPRAAQLFRVSVGQMLGDPIVNLVAPAGRDGARTFLSGGRGGQEPGGPRILETEGRRYDGTLFPAELSVVDSLFQGDPARVVVVRDVTNQKRAERMLRRALEEAEANSRAKSSFLANMSHELRTPLNSVIGFANILIKRQGERLPERETDYLRRIQANGEHLLALIEDILDLSKIDAQRMEVVMEGVDPVELAREVTGTLDLQARRRGLELRVETPERLRPVESDRRRLRQVLLNLVGNALKFTENGTVTVRVVGDEEAERALAIEVEDTGVGIPDSHLEDIFAPFHQVDASQARSHGGTGLGLAISRSLCELMGFELRARSRVGKGSVFTVDLAPGLRGADLVPAAGERPGSDPTAAGEAEG